MMVDCGTQILKLTASGSVGAPVIDICSAKLAGDIRKNLVAEECK
jgi:hypothetical protein